MLTLAATSGAGQQLGPAAKLVARPVHELAQLGIQQGRGFARGAADHDASRTLRDVQFQQALPGTVVDRTIRAHGSDDRDVAAREHADP